MLVSKLEEKQVNLHNNWKMSKKTVLKRNKIKKRIRKVVFGTKDKPRLTVFRSNKEIYAQLIDDSISKTIVAASSKDKDLKLKREFERLFLEPMTNLGLQFSEAIKKFMLN